MAAELTPKQALEKKRLIDIMNLIGKRMEAHTMQKTCTAPSTWKPTMLALRAEADAAALKFRKFKRLYREPNDQGPLPRLSEKAKG